MAQPITAFIIAWSLVGALGCGFLSWIARNVWRDLRQTRLFSYLGVLFTLVFMMVVLRYL